MRPAWSRLDQAYAGAIIVNPDVMPDESVLFDGALVAERTTGIIWRAQRNAAGVFEKRYIRYPWRASFFQGNQNYPSAGVGIYGAWGYQTIEGGSINATQEHLVQNRLVIPVAGVYEGSDWLKWTDTAVPGAGNNLRSHIVWVNDQAAGSPLEYIYYEETTRPTIVNNVCISIVKINRKFNKGDTVCGAVWQDSGVNLPTDHRIQLALVRPTGG